MKRLILGIIAVGVLQLGLISYTMHDGASDVAVAPADPVLQSAGPLPRVSDITPVSETARTEESVPPKLTARISPPVPEKISVQSDRSQKLGPKERKLKPARSAQPNDFETVVISYPGRSATTDCDLRETVKPKGRSFTARAGTIAKKPWELIKTIASKLN